MRHERNFMEEAHMKKTAKITALCNQKGGVGKTVTAVNLGISYSVLYSGTISWDLLTYHDNHVNLLLLPYMVSIYASYVITLHIKLRVE